MPPVTLTADSPDHPCREIKTHSFRVLCAFTQQLLDLPELLRDGTAVLTALAAKPTLRSKGGETDRTVTRRLWQKRKECCTSKRYILRRFLKSCR